MTIEGAQAWDVLMRAQNQVRAAGMTGVVVGLDLGAALSLGAALGYDTAALAELLPAGEAGMIAALIERQDKDKDG